MDKIFWILAWTCWQPIDRGGPMVTYSVHDSSKSALTRIQYENPGSQCYWQVYSASATYVASSK